MTSAIGYNSPDEYNHNYNNRPDRAGTIAFSPRTAQQCFKGTISESSNDFALYVDSVDFIRRNARFTQSVSGLRTGFSRGCR